MYATGDSKRGGGQWKVGKMHEQGGNDGEEMRINVCINPEEGGEAGREGR